MLGLWGECAGLLPSPAPRGGVPRLKLLLCPSHLVRCTFIPQWCQRPDSALMWGSASPIYLSRNNIFLPLGWTGCHLYLYFLQETLLRTRLKVILQLLRLQRQISNTVHCKFNTPHYKSKEEKTLVWPVSVRHSPWEEGGQWQQPHGDSAALVETQCCWFSRCVRLLSYHSPPDCPLHKSLSRPFVIMDF